MTPREAHCGERPRGRSLGGVVAWATLVIGGKCCGAKDAGTLGAWANNTRLGCQLGLTCAQACQEECEKPWVSRKGFVGVEFRVC